MGGIIMLIQVAFTDNRYDYVKHNMLDDLINSKSLKMFKRTTGWVDVESGPLRGSHKGIRYTGKERRNENTSSNLPYSPKKEYMLSWQTATL